MAENSKSLLGESSGDALGAGAARLTRLIEQVQRQQAVPAEKPHRPEANPLLASSPGEEWAKRFQTQVIGPDMGAAPAPEFAPVPRGLVLPPAPTEALVPPKAPEIAPKVSVSPPDLRFGRPEKPRRSWFSRVFLGG